MTDLPLVDTSTSSPPSSWFSELADPTEREPSLDGEDAAAVVEGSDTSTKRKERINVKPTDRKINEKKMSMKSKYESRTTINFDLTISTKTQQQTSPPVED